MIRFVLISTILLVFASHASAGEALIPSPYPDAVPGAAPLDPEPSRIGGPQILAPDPYPQLLGNSAQGNAPIVRRHRNQRLTPSISQRKYRVDRPNAGE